MIAGMTDKMKFYFCSCFTGNTHSWFGIGGMTMIINFIGHFAI
jgi:hypothetical protein